MNKQIFTFKKKKEGFEFIFTATVHSSNVAPVSREAKKRKWVYSIRWEGVTLYKGHIASTTEGSMTGFRVHTADVKKFVTKETKKTFDNAVADFFRYEKAEDFLKALGTKMGFVFRHKDVDGEDIIEDGVTFPSEAKAIAWVKKNYFQTFAGDKLEDFVRTGRFKDDHGERYSLRPVRKKG